MGNCPVKKLRDSLKRAVQSYIDEHILRRCPKLLGGLVPVEFYSDDVFDVKLLRRPRGKVFFLAAVAKHPQWRSLVSRRA